MSEENPAPEEAKVRLTIDGLEIEAEPGQMLLQAALDNGVEIPHYCYHPKLSIDGSCRMCQVKVEGGRKLAISCNEPVRDGMVVDTQCDEVKHARQGVLELLLVNHPLDCPICDQAGECFLQDYSHGYGRDHARTTAPRRKGVKRSPIGEHVVFDQERCILCRRCVRFTQEISQTDELRVFGIGDHSHIGTMPDAPLNNDYSVNVADICPVGALLSSDFHHKRRVWFLEDTPSVCPSCSKGCNVNVGVFKNEVQRMVPRRNDAVNDTWMCDHGRLRYAFTSDETRIRQAQVRNEEGELVDTPFRLAIAAVAEQLRACAEAPDSLGVIASPHLTNEESFLLAALCNQTIPAANVALPVVLGDSDEFLIQEEKAANAAGARAMGIAERGGTLADLASAIESGSIRTLLVFGSDALEVPGGEELLAAVAKLESLVLVAPNQNALQQHASIVIPGATFAEKDGTFTNHEGRVQWISRALNLPEGVETEGSSLARIQALLADGKGELFDPIVILGKIAEAVPEYAHINRADLSGEGLLSGIQEAPGPEPEPDAEDAGASGEA